MSARRALVAPADGAVAAVAAAFGILVLLAFEGTELVHLSGLAMAGVQLAGVAIALLARRYPLAAFSACLLVSLVVPLGALPATAYALARWHSRTRPAVAAALVGLVLVSVVWLFGERAIAVDRISTYVIVSVLGWAVGASQRSAETAAAAEAAREEAERARRADAVRQEERDRLAREMHDVVAHRISLMVLDANRIEAGSAPSSTAVAGEIRSIGQAALDDMREVLGRLRREDLDDGLARQSLTEVEVLVDSVRAVGQPVELVLHARSRQPPDLAERTAVRIVREGLTNAARHAPGAATVVDIADGPGSMLVEVRNEAPTSDPAVALTTGGHGLVGMRERVEMVGGQWHDGPTATGGFVVRAVLPRAEQ